MKDISVKVDGSLIYMGSLPMVDSSKYSVDTGSTILFTNDAAIVRTERCRVTYCGSTDQDVLCIDERQVIFRSKAMFERPSPFAEGIQADLSRRPQTMMSGKS